MKNANDRKGINNEIMQLKTFSRAGKKNLLIILLRYPETWFTDFPCVSPSIPQVILLCFTPPSRANTWTHWLKIPSTRKKSVGCGGRYSELTSRFHSCFIKVVLKRQYTFTFLPITRCLGLKSCFTIRILTAGCL